MPMHIAATKEHKGLEPRKMTLVDARARRPEQLENNTIVVPLIMPAVRYSADENRFSFQMGPTIVAVCAE